LSELTASKAYSYDQLERLTAVAQAPAAGGTSTLRKPTLTTASALPLITIEKRVWGVRRPKCGWSPEEKQDALIAHAEGNLACGVIAKPQPKIKTCPYTPGGNSFDGDAMVWIKDGLKQIKDIEVGEQVLAWDPVSNGAVLKPVIGTSSRIAAGDIYRLTLMDGAGKRTTTIVTGNHPYLLAANDTAPLALVAANDNGVADPTVLRIEPGGDWKIVRNLKPGNKVRTALNGALSGGTILRGPGHDALTVVSVEVDRAPRRVYNFEVEGLHSFAVGELGEWVHNEYSPSPPPPPGRPVPDVGFKAGPGSGHYRYYKFFGCKGYKDKSGNLWVPGIIKGLMGPTGRPVRLRVRLQKSLP
jgi:hypothetical protein